MSRTGKNLGAVAVLGGACAARTFAGPGALALRGRPRNRWGRGAILALTVGEAIGDKFASGSRSEAPGLAGRAVSGALSGATVGGARGARVGAGFALAATYPSERLRARLVAALGIPDPACALAEDAIVYGGAWLASRALDAGEAEDGPGAGEAAADGEPPGALRAIAAGLAAGLVGTAAMTSAQVAYERAIGAGPSEAPRQVGERILGRLGHRVPRDRRSALGLATHLLYGSSWGAPYGLLGRRRPGPATGLAFGAGVWATSLAELPVLGVAPPPWRQPPLALAADLGFHLAYGFATAAAFEALSA
jgi:hypothetical protein